MVNVDVFIAVCIILFLTIVYERKKKPAKKAISQIPGTKPANDQEGNLDEIKSCGSLHQFLEKYHKQYGPIISFWYGPKMWVSIASSKLFEEHAAHFDRPVETFMGLAPVLGETNILLTNGNEGRERHSAYLKSLNPTSIKTFYKIFNRLGKDMIEQWLTWPEDKHIKVQEEVFQLSIKSILESMFGEEFENNELVMKLHAAYEYCWNETERYMIGDVPKPGSSREAEFKKTKNILDNIMLDQLSKRRQLVLAEEERLPIDAMIELQMTESTTVSDLMTLFIGGFHTTATMMAWCIYYLSTHLEVQNKVRDEVMSVLGSSGHVTAEMVAKMTYLRQVLNETLRLATIVTYSARIHHSDMVIGGYKVPAEVPVVHAFGLCLYDETTYPNPLKFDPNRFSPENEPNLPPFSFEPFGFGGKRKCPGYNFAYAEATVYLSLLIRSFEIELAYDQVPERDFGFVSKPKEDFWVTAKPI